MRDSAMDPIDDSSPIGPLPALGVWATAWLGGAVVIVAVATIVGIDPGEDPTIPQFAAAAIAGWAVWLAALWFASRRFGSGDAVADYAVRFRPVDVVAVPIGVAAQLVAIPVVYQPLRAAWPDTFSVARLERRTSELADAAGGSTTVLLVALVAVGAPIIEELVYRGLLQRSFAAALGRVRGYLVVSALFALIHPEPVEYPGLVVAGLVFGACTLVTGRVGPAIVAHAAFNATALAVALT